MASIPWTQSRMRWLQIIYLISNLITLTLGQFNSSSFYVKGGDTYISINLPPNSQDINFYIDSPEWYSYSAIGFGADMSDALMLIMHRDASGTGVTVSPRRSTGRTEPVYDPQVRITLHPFNEVVPEMRANGTCHSCRSLLSGPWAAAAAAAAAASNDGTAPLIYAFGPNKISLETNELDAPLRRHVSHGQVSVSLSDATGPGGIGPPTLEAMRAVSSEIDARHTSTKASIAHGVMFAIVAVAIAPFDMLVGRFLKRWPKLHSFTTGGCFAFVMGAFIPGVIVSGQHLMTKKFATPHQILGMITIVLMVLNLLLGIWLWFSKRRNSENFDQASKAETLLGQVRKWAGRLILVLLLVNVGVGLHLSARRTILILAYAALVGGAIVLMVPIYFVLWRCTKKREPKQGEQHELQESIYDHWHNR